MTAQPLAKFTTCHLVNSSTHQLDPDTITLPPRLTSSSRTNRPLSRAGSIAYIPTYLPEHDPFLAGKPSF